MGNREGQRIIGWGRGLEGQRYKAIEWRGRGKDITMEIEGDRLEQVRGRKIEM